MEQFECTAPALDYSSSRKESKERNSISNAPSPIVYLSSYLGATLVSSYCYSTSSLESMSAALPLLISSSRPIWPSPITFQKPRGGVNGVRIPATVAALSSEIRSHGNGGAGRVQMVQHRAEEIAAEIKALARAADAPVYSSDILDRKYGSRPFKVR